MAVEVETEWMWERQREAQASLEQASNPTVVHAIDLHKAKFDQQKAYEEYQDERPAVGRLDDGVFERSVAMVEARDATTEEQSHEGPTDVKGSGGRWIGSRPVYLDHSLDEVYVVGYPYLLGVVDGTPRVVLNVVLPEKEVNVRRVYANEWARPWVIANVLDANGVDTSDLLLGTLKAHEGETRASADGTAVGKFLDGIARKTVAALLESPDKFDTALPTPAEPAFDHVPSYARAEFVEFDPRLYERLGHGDGFRDVLEMLLGEQEPKGTPPDRGLSLPYALGGE